MRWISDSVGSSLPLLLLAGESLGCRWGVGEYWLRPASGWCQGLSGPYAENVPELTNPGILPALLRIATRCDAPPKHGRPLGVYVCICAIGQEQTCRIEDIFFYKYS
jgi:hypothetical protein